jgi:hypothetical protein
MRTLQSGGLMQKANDANIKEPTTTLTETLGSKSIIVSQKRHARGQPRLSLSCMDMYKAANSRCENSLLQACITAQKVHHPPHCPSVPPITSSRGPPGCPRLPGVSVPPQEPKSECCAKSQHLRRNHMAAVCAAAVFSRPTWCPA